MRNEIEQQTLVDITNQNLETQRKVLEIDRDGEYARLDQEREVEIRHASQRADLTRERAIRDRQAEQAQLAAREAVELSRMAQAMTLTEERLRTERETQSLEIARCRALDEIEMKTREQTEREQIARELALQSARIQRKQARQSLEIESKWALEIANLERQIALAEKALQVTKADGQKRRGKIVSQMETEAGNVAQQRALDAVRISRECNLVSLEIAKRQAFEEAEIEAGEEVQRARIVSDRGIDEARLITASELRQMTIDRAGKTEIAKIQKAIDVAKKTVERSAAQAAAEEARSKAVAAEEQNFTVREREIAERRKLIDLINAGRMTEAERIAAKARAGMEVVKTSLAAIRYGVDAEGARQLNEAENAQSDDARAGCLRAKLLDHLEGIVRESVKPLEKIVAIKILHVEGMGTSTGGSRNVTDEVIDSALRYRVQAPVIDSLMKEIGIEGGSLGRMTDVLRDAKDIASLTKGKAAKDDRPQRRQAPEKTGTNRMPHVYVSSIIPAPAAEVWRIIRDFNGLPDGTPFFADSRIESAMASNQIGCIRNFRLKDGGMIREKLLALSDYDLSCTYAILESPMAVSDDRWHPAITQSRIEEGASDAVGAVRRFRLGDGSELREQLLALSDAIHEFRYCLLSCPLPLMGCVARVRLRPVTDGNRTLWEWSSEFTPPPYREAELTALVRDGIYRPGFEAIRQTVLDGATRGGTLSKPKPSPSPQHPNGKATRAIVVAEYGLLEVMQLRCIPLADPGPGQVQIRHTAIGVNFIDVYCRAGLFPLLQPPGTPGMEAAGVIEAIGPGVTQVSSVERVAYACPPVGSYAEQRTMSPGLMVHLGQDISDQTAASSLLKGVSASFLRHDIARLQPGMSVLTHAAAGGHWPNSGAMGQGHGM